MYNFDLLEAAHHTVSLYYILLLNSHAEVNTAHSYTVNHQKETLPFYL